MPKKLTHEEVKSYIESFEYKLLSSEYKNCMKKLKLQCPEGHIFKKSFDCFKRGQKCPICGNKNKGSHNKYDNKQVENLLEECGYKLLSNYKNVKEKIKIKCPENHIFYMSFGNFNQGHRCPKCYGIKTKNRCKLDYNKVKDYIESYNYKLLSTNYINNHFKLKIECAHGHIFYKSFSNFQSSQRCSIC